MENLLRPVIVVGGAVVLTLVIGWASDLLLRKADDRHHETPLWGLLRRGRIPYQLVLCAALLRGSYDEAELLQEHRVGIGRSLTLVLIGSTAWLVIRIAAAIVQTSYERYASARAQRDPARVRRVRTQVALIMRVVSAVVGVMAVAAMLLTFPAMRAAGASLLASAGIVGIVAGVAAQSTLSNMFAGFQIAFGDMVRLGDVVVVDGEWGTVEDVTLTYLTVRTWDERRITMPVSYFTSKPFENWSRGTPQMTGIVYWHLDHSAPTELMREKLRDILRECPAWDGRDYGLVVTDSTPNTLQVRALVTAKDADDVWTVRVAVREQMIRWLAEHHPYALPRVNTAGAVPPPGRVPSRTPWEEFRTDHRAYEKPRTGRG
ncbi:mechanosensitive ion channel [Streptomyces longwoodensis]|uniref:Mechanosensitive ion channel n=1 Tax=Streptomyces lasalocidi TaxID=324833 RepID=A0A4U5WH52_STRLS|nr:MULTISPECIES: mechanosensitive ion channel domain-containing protein [Streptomyces]MCX4998809.1 mechanosensitive ion channel family protein [Streptomyces longwoodensis]TKT00321.1 mechanosensitive ion channel [Streptomyces lasalocidi]WRY88121.1 mechanosensitive ion channel family protein [Streptomyces longwoodensis]WTI47592.1 mechanosensitive ion channel family protein [Streptomyces longwoodensis]WUC60332.1 mechanosensitive ion channel family protein [Streptomyces longwoodensis]